jgi:hypothetical protein
MKADGGTAAPRPPASEDHVQALSHFPEVCESSIQVRPLPQHQTVNVPTRQTSGSLDRDDLLDLVQTKTEPLRLVDERQQVQRVYPVDAVARGSAPDRGEDACLLI